MLDVSKIEKIVFESFKNINTVISESKNDLKSFKVTQAEEIKNLIIEDDENIDLSFKLENFQEELKKRENKFKSIISSTIIKEIENLKADVLSKLQKETQDVLEDNTKEKYIDLEEFDSSYLNEKNVESEFKEVTNKFFESNEQDEPFKTEDLDQWIKDIKKLI